MTGTNTWKWAPGNHCLTYETVWTVANGTARAFALCGWDSLKNQLVETEYWTGNGTNTLRYSKVNERLWEGTMLGVSPDGKAEMTGKISYEIKRPTHLIFRATDTKAGGNHSRNLKSTTSRSRRQPEHWHWVSKLFGRTRRRSALVSAVQRTSRTTLSNCPLSRSPEGRLAYLHCLLYFFAAPTPTLNTARVGPEVVPRFPS